MKNKHGIKSIIKKRKSLIKELKELKSRKIYLKHKEDERNRKFQN